MLVKERLLLDDMIIYQDDTLYRFTSDAVLLSHFASVKTGDEVADLCSGSGIVGINLFALNRDKIKSVTLFEMQKPLHDLAALSVKENRIGDRVTAKNQKVQDIEKEYNGRFSLVVCNPPYEEVGTGATSDKEEIALCRTEKALSLSELCINAARILKFGGRFALSHRADRLADVIYNLKINGIEPKRVRFVYSGKNKTPYLILIEGVKGGKKGIKILEHLNNGEIK